MSILFQSVCKKREIMNIHMYIYLFGRVKYSVRTYP